MTNAFKPGDMVKAKQDIISKRHEIMTIKKDTVGIIHYCDPQRAEAAILFVGHLMAYGISLELVKKA